MNLIKILEANWRFSQWEGMDSECGDEIWTNVKNDLNVMLIVFIHRQYIIQLQGALRRWVLVQKRVADMS